MSSGTRRKATSKPKGPSSKKLKNIDLGYREGEDGGDDDDEIVESDSDDDFGGKQHNGGDDPSSDEEDKETVDAKRVRLAREYLRKLEDVDDSSSDEDDDDNDGNNGGDKISMRLQRERLKREGTLERAVADHVAKDLAITMQSSSQSAAADDDLQSASKQWIDSGKATYMRGHDLTVTCVALQASGEKAVSGSKDNSVILWDIETQKKTHYLCNQWKKGDKKDARSNGEALSVAMSDDGRYAVVGRRDATVAVFDIRLSAKKTAPNLASSFKGHKGPVTCLAFRTLSNQLFSGSEDRCIRHYSLDEMTYMETLYGHQAGVSDIDCHRKERPFSVGRDRTARAWKLSDDTHLIFRGGAKVSSADRVSVLRDDWFVTGHDDGNLSLWLTDKKKAVKTIDEAHGKLGTNGRGITAIGALKGSDMVASGSSDGYLRLWKIMMGQTIDERGIAPIGQIPVHGYVNDVAIGPKARFCVVAVGQEPCLGRWNRVAKAKNRFGIIQLRSDDGGKDDEDDGAPEEAETIRMEVDDEDE
jgi:ribosomal RNA-processing protein 9